MRYHHRLGDEAVVQSESNSFHLSRKGGGYLSLGVPNVTRYQGLTTILPHGQMWELVKSVENIGIDDELESIVLLPDAVERVYKGAIERIAVQRGATSYEVRRYTGTVRISLDMRFIHDFEPWGRHYTIQDVPGGHVVTYHCPRYQFCLAILGAKGTFHDEWQPIQYAYDKRRESKADFSVLRGISYDCSQHLQLRFGVGWTPAQAIAQANDTQPQEHLLSHPSSDAAFQAAVADLDGLVTTLPHLELGILAGYPWFYQVYTRDEAISCGGLIKLGAFDAAKRILLRELQHILPDGRISNRFPASEIASADSVGWAFLRLHELSQANALTPDELRYVHRLLEQSLQGLERHHMHDGLVTNGWKETWMDTTGGFEDGRHGSRIEIQALTLAMYAFMAYLCDACKDGDSQYYRQRADVLASTVRARFFDERTGSLADGVVDHVDRTARPNLFIAAYAYPQLLSSDEWRRVFRYSLDRLWLPWGGLATIDKEHLLFTPAYSGETDRSYHRGDSWYFLNNIAAVCLSREGFASEAHQILAASRNELLTLGIPGHASETSSAQQSEGMGCFSQAWSAATFVELSLALQR